MCFVLFFPGTSALSEQLAISTALSVETATAAYYQCTQDDEIEANKT
jgi:hypothetical protein